MWHRKLFKSSSWPSINLGFIVVSWVLMYWKRDVGGSWRKESHKCNFWSPSIISRSTCSDRRVQINDIDPVHLAGMRSSFSLSGLESLCLGTWFSIFQKPTFPGFCICLSVCKCILLLASQISVEWSGIKTQLTKYDLYFCE